MEIVNDSVVTQTTTKSDDKEVNLEDKGVETSDRPAWLPEKFETGDALAESYGNLERELTRKSQELADKNRLMDEYILSKVTPQEVAPAPVDFSTLDGEGLPGQKVGSLVGEAISAVTEPLIKEVTSLKNQLASIATKTEVMGLEPDYMKYQSDTKFIDWANNNFPQGVLQSANVDSKTAAWIVGEYKKRFNTPDDTTVTEDADTNVTIPATSQGKTVVTGKKIWSRMELTKLRAENPDEYQRLSAEIDQAYKDGRVK